MLTGYPSTTYNFSKWSGLKLLEVIDKADDAHHVMWSSSKQRQSGIAGGHVYSVLSHTTWDNKDFIQLRNPWAAGEYSGKWSDKDKDTDAT